MTTVSPAVAASGRRSWGHRHRALLLAVGASLVAIGLAVRLRPVVLYDDAAITARYVTRLIDGQGWTYNPGDRTNGASAPLFTLVVALLHAAGLEVVVALRIVTTLAYAASVGLVAYLGTRISGTVAGLFGAALLLTWPDFAAQGLSGMEGAVASALGLGVLVAIVHDDDTWTGVLLGLALLNKLDAGMLAIAVAAVHLAVRHRPPWRIAGVSAAVLAPWLLFSTAYFGAPLPNSFTQKAAGELTNPDRTFERDWMIDALRAQSSLWVVLLAMLAVAVVPLVAARDRRAASALAVALAWPALHLLAFSVVDLGDAYPWYLTVLYPPLSLAAGCTLGTAVHLARRRGPAATAVTLAGATLAAAAALGVVGPAPDAMADDLDRMLERSPVTNDYLQFEQARRTAGARVAELAEPGDVIRTCFGWIAFEAIDHPIDEVCPLNTREETAPPRWYVTASYPGDAPPPLPDGARIVETIWADSPSGGRVDIVRLG